MHAKEGRVAEAASFALAFAFYTIRMRSGCEGVSAPVACDPCAGPHSMCQKMPRQNWTPDPAQAAGGAAGAARSARHDVAVLSGQSALGFLEAFRSNAMLFERAIVHRPGELHARSAPLGCFALSRCAPCSAHLSLVVGGSLPVLVAELLELVVLAWAVVLATSESGSGAHSGSLRVLRSRCGQGRSGAPDTRSDLWRRTTWCQHVKVLQVAEHL